MNDSQRSATDDELEAALASPALADFAAGLRASADGSAPAMTSELEELVASMSPLAAARARRRRTAMRSGVVGAIAIGLGVSGVSAAAAANDLPRPAQVFVSRIVNTVTPFHVPNPDEHGGSGHQGTHQGSGGGNDGQENPLPTKPSRPEEHGSGQGADQGAGQGVGQVSGSGAGSGSGSGRDGRSNRSGSGVGINQGSGGSTSSSVNGAGSGTSAPSPDSAGGGASGDQ